MGYLENAKTYTGNSLDTIFFRPMLTGPSANDLGVRILYNMPLPTTVQLWEGQSDILKKYTTAGWTGGKKANKLQKTIRLNRVKAEVGFSAADYFSLVYENITNRADVNMDDLTGTELELAETELFRRSIAEGIRATMWIGDTASTKGFNTFDGFLKSLAELDSADAVFYSAKYTAEEIKQAAKSAAILDDLWVNSNERLKDMRADGQLAYFVTSDIYHAYEKFLDSMGAEGAYVDYVNGRKELCYHGIPLVDVRISSYLNLSSSYKSFCFLTDRRNMILAVNTSDFPGNEVRMWYNPDAMENRQRAVFMAGCEILDEGLVSIASLQS